MKLLYCCAAAIAVTALIVAEAGCGSGPGSSPVLQFSSNPPATVPVIQLSIDTFTNSTSQHATEVEPASFFYTLPSGSTTIVSAFQVGRIPTAGSADIGYATSKDGGATWQNGFLPGLTTFQGGGTNAAVSDPSVAYDQAHGAWIIASLTVASTQVVVSTSSDGIHWSNPILVSHTPDPDKNWITCDNTPSSPFYGHCYVEWDDFEQSDLIYMSTSTDGGNTWGAALNNAGAEKGIGGQPLVQPNGTVIVPILDFPIGIASFTSTDGGASWSAPVKVAAVSNHQVAGGLRTDPLPSAQIDGGGSIYVVWPDCSFRTSCSSNDLVMSTSADGTHWSPKARIPIDAATSAADHFIPGLGIDSTTTGSTAHLGLTYYYYPQANCTVTTCALYVGFISSADGGKTWSAATPVRGPMALSWLPSTSSGQMVGDYIATSFAGGRAYGIFAVAKAKSGSAFDEAIYTTQTGFDVAAAEAKNSSAGEQPVANAPGPSPPRSYVLKDPVRR